MKELNWPINKDWQRGQSRPEHVNLRFYTTAGFMLVYLGILLALTVQQWPAIEPALEQVSRFEFSSFDPLLMLPVMVLIGLLGLPAVGREFLRWRRNRSLVLRLDPVPAALDGQLGGSLTIPFQLKGDARVRVTLNCMHRKVVKGKNNAGLRDELLWQTQAAVRQQPSLQGTRIELCAELSPQQPETSFSGGAREIWWALHVEEPDSGFDVIFPVPVSAQASKKNSGYRFSERERSQALEAQNEPVRSWQQTDVGDGTRFDFPAGRSGKMAWVLLLVGLIFTGVAIFMGYTVWEELNSPRVSYFSVMVQGMILFGFGLFSPGLLLLGLYMRLNRLQLVAGPITLSTTRTCVGLTKQRQIPVSEIDGLAERIIGRMGQGVESELEYAVEAYMKDGQRVRLADGVQGQSDMEKLLAQLRLITGISHRPEPSEYRLQRKTPPAWVSWLPVLFKLIGMLVFGLTVGAFVLDALSL